MAQLVTSGSASANQGNHALHERVFIVGDGGANRCKGASYVITNRDHEESLPRRTVLQGALALGCGLVMPTVPRPERCHRRVCSTRTSQRVTRAAADACISSPDRIPASWSTARSTPTVGVRCGPGGLESPGCLARARGRHVVRPRPLRVYICRISRSLRTSTTPSTVRASSPARVFAVVESTKPVSCTTPFCVSTLIW